MNRQLITYKSLLPVQRNPATSEAIVTVESTEAKFKSLKKTTSHFTLKVDKLFWF